MKVKFEARPARRPSGRRLGTVPTRYPYDAIVATVENGQAVRVPMKTTPLSNIRIALQLALKRRGYRAHSVQDGTDVLVWASALNNGG